MRHQDAPTPIAEPGEVLIRIHAASLNPLDPYLRDGYRALAPQWRPNPTFPLIPSTDISGVVATVGAGVCGFSVGDEVYAMVRFPQDLTKGSGAYSEYIRVPESELALKPMGIEHLQAAGVPMSPLPPSSISERP